jgi:hypothetical protein
MTHGRSTGDTTLADGADGATIGGAMTLRTRWSTLAAGGRGLTSIVLAMLAVGSACGAGQHLLRRPVTMQELTVPKPRLPEGCSLKVIEPPRRDINPVAAPWDESVDRHRSLGAGRDSSTYRRHVSSAGRPTSHGDSGGSLLRRRHRRRIRGHVHTFRGTRDCPLGCEVCGPEEAYRFSHGRQGSDCSERGPY